MTFTLPSPLSKGNTSHNTSEYLKAAVDHFDSASKHAEAGDLTAAAISILKALEQERRAKGVGPQVLQLIKTGA